MRVRVGVRKPLLHLMPRDDAAVEGGRYDADSILGHRRGLRFRGRGRGRLDSTLTPSPNP